MVSTPSAHARPEAKPGASSFDYLQERLRTTLSETGPSGLVVRGSRWALLRLSEGAQRAAARLLEFEARRRISGDERRLAQRNEMLRGMHRGQRCFIVGTGPSLNKLDLERLKGEIYFGVNSLVRHPIMKVAPPRYYALRDDLFFAPGGGADDLFAQLRELQDTLYLLPSAHHRRILGDRLLPADRSFFFPGDGNMAETPQQEIDLGFIPYGHNVLPFALAIAIAMGFNEIILLGADHNWLATPYSYTGMLDSHFDHRPSLASARSVPAVLDSYRRTAQHVVTLWSSYEWLGRVARRGGQRIINATPGSYLDVFPQASYESLFERG